ncbi:unnamed protein product [Tuber aestivum]|uniref:Uncharacterized protein n=1 Tax=Tuber aestivum TaxID=59557 RepID=A0A292PY55_9PEZI|nr:unnamed protein product [Tuber aestivum]
MAPNKKDKGKQKADDSGKVDGESSWFGPSSEFREETLIPLAEAQGTDTVENSARPPISGKYRLRCGSGRGESLASSSSSSARVIDKQKGVQQDLRALDSEFGGGPGHRRIRSEISGSYQTGRMQDLGQRYSATFNQDEGDGADSNGASVRRGKGAFYFGDIPLPSTHRIYKSGLGWIPEGEETSFPLGQAGSGSLGSGAGRSGDSNIVRSKSFNGHPSRSFESDGNVKFSSSSGGWRRDQGKALTSSGDTNYRDMPSKSGSSSYLSRPPATSKQGNQPHMSNALENLYSKPDYPGEQAAGDYVSDATGYDVSSDGPLLTLLCDRVIKESQRCNELSSELESAGRRLARAEYENHVRERAIGELSLELRLMGPRLDLNEAQRIVHRDVASILASGGTPPLDITLGGWTYIRVGEPGEGWVGDSYTPVQPFPPGRRPYPGDRQPSPTLPAPSKLASREGDGRSARLQPSPERPSGMGNFRLSPPNLSPHKRHTWSGNRRSSPGKSSPRKRLPREGFFVSPVRPVHRHDDASASPGISYLNWRADEEEKQRRAKS